MQQPILTFSGNRALTISESDQLVTLMRCESHQDCLKSWNNLHSLMLTVASSSQLARYVHYFSSLQQRLITHTVTPVPIEEIFELPAARGVLSHALRCFSELKSLTPELVMQVLVWQK